MYFFNNLISKLATWTMNWYSMTLGGVLGGKVLQDSFSPGSIGGGRLKEQEMYPWLELHDAHILQ